MQQYRDFFKEDMIPGGKGDSIDLTSIDPKELAMGMKVELEHTGDERLAKEIASDHLSEDPQYYSRLKQAGLADELADNGAKTTGIRDVPVSFVKKDTVPGTVFKAVELDGNSPDMRGCIGGTPAGNSDKKSNVDAPATDPSPEDHVTGGMSSTPVNPNILTKGDDDTMDINVPGDKVVAQDISIDIAEGKRIMGKMKSDAVKEKRWTVKWG
jgi:hypothetical protein